MIEKKTKTMALKDDSDKTSSVDADENEAFWIFVVKVELALLVPIVLFLVLGHFSRRFRAWAVWFVEVRAKQTLRRLGIQS